MANIKQLESQLAELKEALASADEEDKDQFRELISETEQEIANVKKAVSVKDKMKQEAEKKIEKLEKDVESPKTAPKVKQQVKKKIASVKKQVKEAVREDERERKAKYTPTAKKKTASAKTGKRGRPKKAAPAPKKVVKKRVSKAEIKYSKALKSLNALVNKTKELKERYKGQGVDLERDASRTSKPFGWRLKGKSTRRPTKAEIKSGKAYWEARPNRADVKRATYPKLAEGGMMKRGGRTKSQIAADKRLKAKKPGWKQSESTGDWYYEDRDNRTDKNRKLRLAEGGMMKKGGRTKLQIMMDKRFKAKKAGWKQSESTGDWYYEDRPNRTDVSRRDRI